MNNALNRLTAEDGPATLRVELQVSVPRRSDSAPSKLEYQRINISESQAFLLECRNTAALAFARREIGGCIKGLDYAKLGAEHEVPKPSVEEVPGHDVDLTPIPQIQGAEVAQNLAPIGDILGTERRNAMPSSRFGDSPSEPKDRRKQTSHRPNAAAACPSCGSPAGSNLTSCFECQKTRGASICRY